MAIPAEKLLEEVLSLPDDMRESLALRLLESLDPLDDDSARTAWTAEALRRRDEVRSGKVKTVSADASRASIERLLSR